MAVLDQDGSGTCYAFAGAQLLEFEQRAKGKKDSLSAIDLGLLASTKEQSLWDRDSIEGGQISAAISGAVNHGVATRACVDQQIRSFTKDTSQTAEQFVTILEQINSSSSIFSSRDKEMTATADALRKNGHTSYCAILPTLEKIVKKVSGMLA